VLQAHAAEDDDVDLGLQRDAREQRVVGLAGAEKMGSFCDSTSVLNTSIIGMPVRTMLRGMMRLAGLTDGPPMSIRFSSRRARGRADAAAGEDAAEQGVGEGHLHRVAEEAHAGVGGDAAAPAKTWRRRVAVEADDLRQRGAARREVTSASSR
jgi:hypothetical protein